MFQMMDELPGLVICEFRAAAFAVGLQQVLSSLVDAPAESLHLDQNLIAQGKPDHASNQFPAGVGGILFPVQRFAGHTQAYRQQIGRVGFQSPIQ